MKPSYFQLICNAVSRNFLNIKGLGESTIARLIDTEDIRGVIDIFKLNEESWCMQALLRHSHPALMGTHQESLQAACLQGAGRFGHSSVGSIDIA